MIKKIILILMILGSFFLEYSLISGDIIVDLWEGIFVLFLSLALKVLSSFYLYKECVGWDNFENPEGFSLKRKK